MLAYEKFRGRLARQGQSDQSYMNAFTGFTLLEHTERLQVEAQGFDEAFVERFHKAICLQSLAVKGRSLALATATTNGMLPRIGDDDCQFWPYPCSSIIIGGVVVPQMLQDKVDRLEVFDLIYHFVLGKLFSVDKLSQWVKYCSGMWMFDEYTYSDSVGGPGSRAELLEYLRYHLSPIDIAGKPAETCLLPTKVCLVLNTSFNEALCLRGRSYSR